MQHLRVRFISAALVHNISIPNLACGILVRFPGLFLILPIALFIASAFSCSCLTMKPISTDPMNAEYRYKTEKCFKDYFLRHRELFRSVDPKAEKEIIQGTKRRVLNEGVLLEGFTFDDWIKHIEEL